MLVYYLLTKRKERGFSGNEFIAKTIVTSELIKDIANDFNVMCLDTLTGFKHISALIATLEGKKTFICGLEESYGYLIGDSVRDKDAVAGSVMISEMAAWAAEQGKSLFELLLHIYKKYGIYHEFLISITKEGIEGIEKIKEMMRRFRTHPPATLAGAAVTKIMDYESDISRQLVEGQTTSLPLPKANVLQFFTDEGTKVSVRPSGTEPKIKFYFSLKAHSFEGDYFQTHETLKQRTDHLKKELGI